MQQETVSKGLRGVHLLLNESGGKAQQLCNYEQPSMLAQSIRMPRKV